MKSSCQLLIVATLSRSPKGSVGIHTANDVVELRGGEDACEMMGRGHSVVTLTTHTPASLP